MREADRAMLAAFADMSEARPVGEPLRPITSTTPEFVGNRKERRIQAANYRKKKKNSRKRK